MSRKYTVLMVLSFIYGGFLIASYIIMVYSIVWRGEVFGIAPFTPRRFARGDVDAISMMTSPLLLLILAGGLISIANGIAIRSLTHKREIKKVKA
ncbi:MAG: hypothetical protein KAU03_05290, partial [Candidatus Altiarchaeales archaeon]|nr:hypothetical protein [Candidatus Altiarchaeales archaeon]